MVADEILSSSTEILGDFDDSAFSLVVLYKFGRISRIDKILKLVSLCKFVPTHKVKVYLILLIFTKQKISENLYLRHILNPIVHQLADEIQAHILEFYLGKLSADQIELFLNLLDLVMFQVGIEKFRE